MLGIIKYMTLFWHRNSQTDAYEPEVPVANTNLRQLLTEQVKPYLQAIGFAQYGSSFYRQRGDIIDVINVQASKSNSLDNQHFFVNCGLDSSDVQQVITGQQKPHPRVYDCLYHVRIEQLVGGSSEYWLIKDSKPVDITFVSQALTEQLQLVLDQYATINATTDLLDLAITTNGLHSYEELCYYLAQRGDLPRLRTYISGLQRTFSQTDPRWPEFADAIYAVIGDVHKDPSIAKLLVGHAPPTHAPLRFKPPS